MKEKVLYLGGFELPDKNAAAQRVVSNAKIFRELGYEVSFIGVSHEVSDSISFLATKSLYEGFEYYAVPYPKSLFSWLKYLTSISYFQFIEDYQPHIIIAYNYPSLPLYKLMAFCKKRGIKLYADVTEWYSPLGNPIKKVLKWLDTEFRMCYLHKRLDGLITISSFLTSYYKEVHTIQLPPLVDLSEQKWNCADMDDSHDEIRMVYAGSPGTGEKDRLDLIIDSLQKINSKKIHLKIVGVTKEQYLNIGFPQPPSFVEFLGRVPHLKVIKILQQSDFQIFIRTLNRVTLAGFPTKFAEAMSCGIPVITNKSSNLDDYLKDGYNGFFIDENNLDSSFNFLKTLKREDIIEMKKNCSQAKTFDYRNYLEQVESFLK